MTGFVRHLALGNGEGFMLVNGRTNAIDAGERFDLSAQEVIDYRRCGLIRDLIDIYS